MESLYDTEGFDATMDVSASTRKFQQSIIVKQDPNKSGILAFLSVAEEQITQLLEISWWDWPIEKIDNNLHLILSDNIDEFIKKALEN